jgi:hypothetical protein
MDCEPGSAVQVYWCYTDQRYWLYLRKVIIDNSLIQRENLIAVISVQPMSSVSILNGSRLRAAGSAAAGGRARG